MEKILIETTTLKTVLENALENKEIVICDRCGVAVLGEDMFGAVCKDCAMDLIEEGLKREEEQMIEEEISKQIFESLLQYGVPIGVCDLEYFIGEKAND